MGKPRPTLIASAGAKAIDCFDRFFVSRIRNRNTRAAYRNAVSQFCTWAETNGYTISTIEPAAVGKYVKSMQSQKKAGATLNQRLAGVRAFFDWLVAGGIVAFNPAASVRLPKHARKPKRAPLLAAKHARQLIDAMDPTTIAGLRDRAVIGMMIFSFAHASAVVSLNVGNFRSIGRSRWICLPGKNREIPAHPVLARYLEEYIEATGIGGQANQALFRSLIRRSDELGNSRMSRVDILRMIKRRAFAVKLSPNICCRTLRGCGIADFLKHGGTVKTAQAIAGYISTESIQLYDESESSDVTVDEIARIAI